MAVEDLQLIIGLCQNFPISVARWTDTIYPDEGQSLINSNHPITQNFLGGSPQVCINGW